MYITLLPHGGRHGEKEDVELASADDMKKGPLGKRPKYSAQVRRREQETKAHGQAPDGGLMIVHATAGGPLQYRGLRRTNNETHGRMEPAPMPHSGRDMVQAMIRTQDMITVPKDPNGKKWISHGTSSGRSPAAAGAVNGSPVVLMDGGEVKTT